MPPVTWPAPVADTSATGRIGRFVGGSSAAGSFRTCRSTRPHVGVSFRRRPKVDLYPRVRVYRGGMLVGELARATGVTVRALRYYESVGLVVPQRLSNGYRVYDPICVRLVEKIRSLMALGLTVEETRPFIESLINGDDEVDAASVATYRRAIDQVSERIGRLVGNRDTLAGQLHAALPSGWCRAAWCRRR